MSPIPLFSYTLFAPCFAPREEGEGCGRSCFSPHQLSCTKTSVPAFLPQKPAGLISSEEQRGGKMSLRVCRDLQLLGQPRQRGGEVMDRAHPAKRGVLLQGGTDRGRGYC